MSAGTAVIVRYARDHEVRVRPKPPPGDVCARCDAPRRHEWELADGTPVCAACAASEHCLADDEE